MDWWNFTRVPVAHTAVRWGLLSGLHVVLPEYFGNCALAASAWPVKANKRGAGSVAKLFLQNKHTEIVFLSLALERKFQQVFDLTL